MLVLGVVPIPALLPAQTDLPLEERLLVAGGPRVQGPYLVVVDWGPIFAELGVLLSASVGGELFLRLPHFVVFTLDLRVSKRFFVLLCCHALIRSQRALKI